MATLALVRAVLDERDDGPLQWPAIAPANDSTDTCPPYERCVYQPSRKAGPLAFLASGGVMLGALAILATLSVVAQHKETSRLTVVEAKELDITPPPPPPKSLEKPVVQPPQAFIPQPKIQLPSPGPTQAAMEVPPPVAPAVSMQAPVSVAATAPVSAAPAPPSSSEPVEGGDLGSQVLSARPPSYPIDARRRQEQGVVRLRLLVGPDGRVSDIEIASSSGSASLDRAALGAVKHWRWKPQVRNGSPVAVRGIVTIPFKLSNPAQAAA